MTLSGATTSDHSGPGSCGNKRVLSIPQSSSITASSSSDCLLSYPEHSLGEGSHASAEKQSVYFTTEWTMLYIYIYIYIYIHIYV